MSAHTTALARLAGQTVVSETRLRHDGSDTATGYKPPTAPAHVYLLAEHLDACLAAGEDLLASSFTWNAPERDAHAAARARIEQREGLALIQALELTLIGRVLRARDHASQLAKEDANFRLIANLFVSGTNTLADAVAGLADPTAERFETGAAATAYLRSRGLIEADAAAPIDGATVRVSEELMVARVVPLGLLLDLVAQFLETLDVRYDLFPAEATPEAAAASAERESETPVPLADIFTRMAEAS
jgi:hypothetical protein